MNQDESQSEAKKVESSIGCLTTILDRVKKFAPLTILVVIILGVLFSVARAAVYKIRPWERGLHVRGGKFIGVDELKENTFWVNTGIEFLPITSKYLQSLP